MITFTLIIMGCLTNVSCYEQNICVWENRMFLSVQRVGTHLLSWVTYVVQ